MKILVTSRHLQPISMKEKRKLVTDIVILRLFTSYTCECERFSAKNGLINSRNCRNYLKNFESKIREYAGPRTVNREWVRVFCIYYIFHVNYDVDKLRKKLYNFFALGFLRHLIYFKSYVMVRSLKNAALW